MNREKHQTHVWVQTEMVETILQNDGTLPVNYKPSRKRGRSSGKLAWGWARAVQTATTSSEPPESPSSAILRRVKQSPDSPKNRKESQSWSSQGGSSSMAGTPVTIMLQDAEFAPDHLYHATVTIDPNHVSGPLHMANTWWNSGGNGHPPDDLTSLVHLHEPAVVYCLKRRFELDLIYTYTGKILLALNPFRKCNKLYGESVMQLYTGDALLGERPPPHIYAVAQDAYSTMLRAMQFSSSSANVNQSILVSGESGAGKTVSTKIIMQYLATLSRSHTTTDDNDSTNQHVDIESQVLQSNPILESFGNARTVRNDNSSRFGKFIEICFSARGSLISASIETYLLEKVRLITQAPGERNYHVFYELLEAMSQRDRRDLCIGNVTARDFRITASSGTFDRRDDVQDRDTYRELLKALDTVGFTPEEQHDLFVVVCALLHASNLTFCSTSAESCELDRTNPSLRSTHVLFGVPIQQLETALCSCAIEARGEVLYKNMSVEQATKALDALIMATYGALFSYIVKRINRSITIPRGSPIRGGDGRMASIGVLDIFGFECFDHNSFEQLCINYCNEALQQQFNRFVFKLEQQEYEREGIEWSFITFPDNQDVLDLIEAKRSGILSILDEQCRLASCTDMSFARATYEQCANHDRFEASNNQKVVGTFSVHHYAGPVEYSAVNFLEKNKDELPKETTELLKSSENPFLSSLGQLLNDQSNPSFPSPPSSAASGSTPIRRLHRQSSSLMRDSVGTQFSKQLAKLRERINQTTPHYVRCLKPNDDLLPDDFHPMVIADQLRCAGVLEAIRVSRVGFPQRYPHSAFLQRYHMLATKALQNKAQQGGMKEACQVLVEQASMLIWEMHDGDSSAEVMSQSNSARQETFDLGIQMGLTKVFLRRQAFDSLEVLRGMKLEEAAIKIQSAARMFVETMRYDEYLVASILIQRLARRIKAARYVDELRRTHAATRIQCAWRVYVANRYLVAAWTIATWCQCAFRGSKGREAFALVLLEHVATKIQCNWRRYVAEVRFQIARWVVVSVQCLWRSFKARQELKRLKFEARDLCAIKAERDKFREEAINLRRELDRKETMHRKMALKTNVNSDEVKRLRTEIEALQTRLQQDKYKQEDEEAKELAIAAERDRFREEAMQLRKELERKEAKQREISSKTEGRAKVTVAPAEVERLRNEIDMLQSQLREEKYALWDDDIKVLAAESAKKDAELVRLRKEIAFLRSPEARVPQTHSVTSPRESPSRGDNGSTPSSNEGRSPSSIFRMKTNPVASIDSMCSWGSNLGRSRSDPIGNSQSESSNNKPTDARRDSLNLSLLDAEQALNDPVAMAISPMAGLNQASPKHMLSFPVDANALPVEAPGQQKPPMVETLMFRKAVREGDSTAVESILNSSKWRDFLVNECDESGQSPLHMAVIDSRWKVVGLLLGNDGVANAQDLSGNTPLHVAPSASMMGLLLDDGRANPNIPNMDGETALHFAVRNLDAEAVDVLLRHGANVNCADNTKWFTPVNVVAQVDLDERAKLELPLEEFEEDKRSQIRIANLLCSTTDPAEADLDYQDWEGNTPLHHVAMLTSDQAGNMLSIFLRKGANPRIMNKRGQTPLHLLCHNEPLRKLEIFQEMIHNMLYHGADPNQTSLTGCTALHLSLYHRDVDGAIQLVNSGAELHLLWRKPKRWVSFWDDLGRSEVLALDMVKDGHSLHRILAAINRPQKWAPKRSCCMQCNATLGSFARALHCRHCGRLVCGACSPRSLAPEFFPKSFEIYEPSWVCVVCEKILVGRKEDNSSTTQPTTASSQCSRISF